MICSCDNEWCSDACAKEDGHTQDESLERAKVVETQSQRWARLFGTCAFCRQEDVEDRELLEFALQELGCKREDLVHAYFESVKMTEYPMPRCLVCEKELRHEAMKVDKPDHLGRTRYNHPPIVYDAGEVQVSFSYGSNHDQGGSGYEPKTPIEKLLSCHEIRGYLCDDCFEKKLHLFEGWDRIEDILRERKI